MPLRYRDCEHCGYTFPAKTAKARYCSDAHRSAAGRARRNEEALLAEQDGLAPEPEPAPVGVDLEQVIALVIARLGLTLPPAPQDDLDDDEQQSTAAPARQEPAGLVEDATRVQLEAAQRADTPLGRAALVLAQRLDNSHAENGGGLRSLATGLRELITAAIAHPGAVPAPASGGTTEEDTAQSATVSPIEARRRASEERRRLASS